MKFNLKYSLWAALLFSVAFFACQKEMKNMQYSNGTAVTLQSNTTTITPSAKDSTSNVLSLSWTNPHYATDSAHQKFIIQMDTTQNFTHPASFEADGPLSQDYTGNQLNTVLASFGFSPGKPFTIHIRVVSSYANNNEAYMSNTVTVTMTGYTVPVTLKSSTTGPLTLSLSNATQTVVSFNWNASPYGTDTINYALELDTAGGSFSNPQIIKCGTSLDTSLTNNDLNTAIIAAGVLGGTAKNIEFRVVSYTSSSYTTQLGISNAVSMNITTYVPVPPNLYIVGDATPGGWANPVPVPSQQFTKVDDYSYSIIVYLQAGGTYLLLPVNGDWSHKYGGASATGGTLLADDAVPGSNTPGPATSGLYQITVNFQTNQYTVTPLGLYIVGDATPGAWNNPVPVPSQQFTNAGNGHYKLTLAMSGGGSFLFLPVNGSWDHKFGGTSATGGALLADGAVPDSNTPGPTTAGTYLIDVDFLTNTYTLTKQ